MVLETMPVTSASSFDYVPTKTSAPNGVIKPCLRSPSPDLEVANGGGSFFEVDILDGVPLLEVIREVASRPDQIDPFFVVDLADIVRKYQIWRARLPRVAPFYAVKCNDCPAVLELLAGLGVNFDCASKKEIDMVLETGVHPSRIIYANPCKTPAYLSYAAKVGVDLMTFDNEPELRKIKALHPQARLVLRIRVDDSYAHYKLGRKFGCELEKASELMRQAQDLGLTLVGVSFHVGSSCHDAAAYSQAIQDARFVFDQARDLGLDLTLLDIGGGFPGKKEPPPYAQFEDMADTINKMLDKLFPVESGVTVIAEPGRYFPDSAFTVATQVIAKRPQDDVQDDTMYYFNDGVFGSFICVVFEPTDFHPFPILDEKELATRKTSKCVLWGPTCDSFDCIIKSFTLPELEIGDWLAFPFQGAYTLTLCTPFNGFPNAVPRRYFLSSVEALEYLRQQPSWPSLSTKFHFQQRPTEESPLKTS